MLAKGWMVAHAGPESAIISATTEGNVTIKTTRFISATSFR
jgi:hypothetical protein